MKLFAARLTALVLMAFCFTAYGVAFQNQSNAVIGKSDTIKCGDGIVCTKTSGKIQMVVQGDGADVLVGFLQQNVAATATTITAAQCGSTFTNASGAVEMELPDASTVLGCRLTFIVGSANALTIDPATGDTILLLTNAAGDALAADAAGESVTIQAIAADSWAPVGAVQGTWTDSN